MAKADLTAQRLRELLHYNPDTGLFTRNKRISNSAPAGAIVGCQNGNGYLRIRLDDVLYHSHRLAWLYTHGRWPQFFIDHINGVRSDNRLCNLRDVTQVTNMQNLRSARRSSRSGVLGIHYYRQTNRWQARIRIHGKAKSLGYFATKEEAGAAYLAAKRLLHEGCSI